MKNIILVALLLPILVSCGKKQSPNEFDISGQLLGEKPGTPIQITVIATSVGGVLNEKITQLPVERMSDHMFASNFPKKPYDGAYQIIAYVDKNDNQRFDIGEKRTQNNNKYLVHSVNGGTGFQKGWNLMDNGRISQPQKISDYDLNW